MGSRCRRQPAASSGAGGGSASFVSSCSTAGVSLPTAFGGAPESEESAETSKGTGDRGFCPYSEPPLPDPESPSPASPWPSQFSSEVAGTKMPNPNSPAPSSRSMQGASGSKGSPERICSPAITAATTGSTAATSKNRYAVGRVHVRPDIDGVGPEAAVRAVPGLAL